MRTPCTWMGLVMLDAVQIGNLAAGARLQAKGEESPARGVLLPEVEEAARVAVLDHKLEAGRVAGVQEGEQRACGGHGEPTIIGRGGDREGG